MCKGDVVRSLARTNSLSTPVGTDALSRLYEQDEQDEQDEDDDHEELDMERGARRN